MRDSRRTEKQSMSRKALFALFGLCTAATIAICCVLIVTTANLVETDDVYDFQEETYNESATPLPERGADALAYLNTLLQEAADNTRVFHVLSADISVEDDSVTWDGPESERNILLYMKNALLSEARTYYPENTTGKFRQGTLFVPPVTLRADECSTIGCSEGRLEEQNGEEVLKDEDSYFFDITVPGGAYPAPEDSSIAATFRAEIGAMLEEMPLAVSHDVIVTDITITPGEFEIHAQSDRLTDQITRISYLRRYNVQAKLIFQGRYADIGVRTLSFEYQAQEKYDYTWASVRFTEESISVEPGKDVQAAVHAILNDDEDYDIAFELSDTSVASIDELGYVRGIAESKEPITLTVRLTYLGHTYTDTCEVYVKYSVEEVGLRKTSLKLAPGESGALEVKISPKKATIQDVIWISEDPAVAEVDDSGRVTAHRAGTVRIHVVSVDGNFMGTCIVTVKEKGGSSNG